MMKNTTEIFSTLKCKRWKGRMVFSLMGTSWRGIFIIDAVYAGSMTALLGLMNWYVQTLTLENTVRKNKNKEIEDKTVKPSWINFWLFSYHVRSTRNYEQ